TAWPHTSAGKTRNCWGGGAGLHGVHVVVDNASRSGLQTCYFRIRLYSSFENLAASQHRVVALLQSPNQCHRRCVGEEQSSRREGAASYCCHAIRAALFSRNCQWNVCSINCNHVFHGPGKHTRPAKTG